jgi:hypothetical protein
MQFSLEVQCYCINILIENNMAIQNVQSLSPNTRLPKWANGLIVVGSLVIVGTVAYYVYKKIKDKEEEKT